MLCIAQAFDWLVSTKRLKLVKMVSFDRPWSTAVNHLNHMGKYLISKYPRKNSDTPVLVFFTEMFIIITAPWTLWFQP